MPPVPNLDGDGHENDDEYNKLVSFHNKIQNAIKFKRKQKKEDIEGSHFY